jgi:hypothetical protein
MRFERRNSHLIAWKIRTFHEITAHAPAFLLIRFVTNSLETIMETCNDWKMWLIRNFFARPYLPSEIGSLAALSLLIILQRQLNRSMLLQLILSKNTIPVSRQARRRFDPP